MWISLLAVFGHCAKFGSSTYDIYGVHVGSVKKLKPWWPPCVGWGWGQLHKIFPGFAMLMCWTAAHCVVTLHQVEFFEGNWGILPGCCG